MSQAVGIGSASIGRTVIRTLIARWRRGSHAKTNHEEHLPPHSAFPQGRQGSGELQRSPRETRDETETERNVGPSLLAGRHLLERKGRPHERVR